MNNYFEETQRSLNSTIDFKLFKKIAFGSGLPFIVQDFLIQLTGQEKLVKKALLLLDERVPKTKKRKGLKSDLGDKSTSFKALNQRVLPFKDQAEFYSSDNSESPDRIL